MSPWSRNDIDFGKEDFFTSQDVKKTSGQSLDVLDFVRLVLMFNQRKMNCSFLVMSSDRTKVNWKYTFVKMHFKKCILALGKTFLHFNILFEEHQPAVDSHSLHILHE